MWSLPESEKELNSTAHLRRSGILLTMIKQLQSMLRQLCRTRKSNPSKLLVTLFYSSQLLSSMWTQFPVHFFFFFFYLLVACKFGIIPTLVVFTLFPEEQLHPLRSGRTLHSSPSRHGCMWHHHFCSTIEATTEENNHICMFTEWTY